MPNKIIRFSSTSAACASLVMLLGVEAQAVPLLDWLTKRAQPAQDVPPPSGATPQPAPAAGSNQQAPGSAKPAAAKPAKAKDAQQAKSKSKAKTEAAETATEGARMGRAAADASTGGPIVGDPLDGIGGKSPLELLASYKTMISGGNLEAAAVMLRLAANGRPTRELIAQISDLLGVHVEQVDAQAMVHMAASPYADAIVSNAKPPPGNLPSTIEARIQTVHATMFETPRHLEALADYREAIRTENFASAVTALTGVLQRPVDAGSVRLANELLGLTTAIPAEQIVAQITNP